MSYDPAPHVSGCADLIAVIVVVILIAIIVFGVLGVALEEALR